VLFGLSCFMNNTLSTPVLHVATSFNILTDNLIQVLRVNAYASQFRKKNLFFVVTKTKMDRVGKKFCKPCKTALIGFRFRVLPLSFTWSRIASRL